MEGVCLSREGAGAMAFADGSPIDLYSPLAATTTRIEVRRGDEGVTVECGVLPGEEKTIRLPFEAAALRAFAGEKEICIYLHAGHITQEERT